MTLLPLDGETEAQCKAVTSVQPGNVCGSASVWDRCGGPEPGMSLVETHVLRQLRGVLEAARAEGTGVRWASAGAVRGTVPGQVAGALEGLATGAARKGLEVRV